PPPSPPLFPYTTLFRSVSAVSASMTLPLIAGTTAGTLMFSNTPLLLPAGSSEPEIAFNGHFMAITSLGWLFPFGTQLWTGDFGRSEEHTSELQSRGHLV